MREDIVLPGALVEGADVFRMTLEKPTALLHVPENFHVALEAIIDVPEVVMIQRLLTMAHTGMQIDVVWSSNIIEQMKSGPSLHPLLAVLLCINVQTHCVTSEAGISSSIDVKYLRQRIYQFRPMADMFSDRQVFICADSRGQGRPRSLYRSDGSLVPRGEFEAFVERLLSAQIGINAGTAQSVKFSQSVSTIVAELFENTDIHGKRDLRGIPFKNNGIRGMIFKRVEIDEKILKVASASRDGERGRSKKPVGLEISVFDSGVGYYASYTKSQLSQSVQVSEEWEVLHRCLQRHYNVEEPITIEPVPTGHTGMGLYEVLRALHYLKGKFEVRSGRLWAYRTFISGETQFQLEPSTSANRPGMPKPVLLDQELKFVRVPTAHEQLVGSTIRVLIPLA